MSSPELQNPQLEGVAIIGMAGRFPGAKNIAEFWRNQLDGVESISHFRAEDLEIPNAAELAAQSNYARSRSVLEDADVFDAEFFGIYPREAELMDPQQRLFLECCWQAFEDAGYDPAVYSGAVGVYAGSSVSTYFLSRLCADPDFIRKFTGGYQVSNYPEMMGNNQDFLATRVSYKLNLRGPSFTMQAGCSTSLLAVTQACQSLLTYQSDMALAGGSSITFPQKRGSFYQEGGMISPDGHCRAFDAAANGTVFGSGVAVVLLKRVEDAVRDGDQIYAVIRGFAVNNDGSAKVGYTAPSVEGQSHVIALAHETAGVNPETIGYIEAHGTGTPLGDPIELAALTQAFRSRTPAKHFCAIGTAKTNVGHLDIAAGVTGLIHAAHIVRHGAFPPTLHYKKPNAKFDLENSPFYVNASRAEWKSGNAPRRAGVSAFGVGGTNAHVIIEQPPSQTASASSRPLQLLTLSARSEAALDTAARNLAEHLDSHRDANLADVAWTLQNGRRAFPFRRTVVARDVAGAIAALSQSDRKRVQSRARPLEKPEVHFLFPGQGSQHPNMARELYDHEPTFRSAVDRCAEILRPHLEADLRSLLYPKKSSEDAQRRVTDTIVAQPAIFTIEYALAQLWMSWGIYPQLMVGHSIGEFVAACLAGVFTLEDALTLVAARGRMMQNLPPGGMLSVRLPESELRPQLNGLLSIAAVNSPFLCVVAGPFDALEKFERQLGEKGIACRRLVTSHAFHSAMMDPIVGPFTERVKQVRLNTPSAPYISGVTGALITEAQATDPKYWARHFREAVQFSAGISELRKRSNGVLLEVGPGTVLTTLARQHAAGSNDQVIVSSLSDGYSGEGDEISLMNALGSLWLAGVQVNWPAFHAGERRLRVSLPTYPFERKRFWLETPVSQNADASVANTASEKAIAASLPTLIEKDTESVNATTALPITVVNSQTRAVRIRGVLAEIFEDLSGMDLSSADGSATFVEMGFDSLFLTQVTQSLQSKFGLKITFRQLLGDQGTLASLAEYVDAKLPSGAFAEATPVASAAPTQAQASSQTAFTNMPPVAGPTAGGGDTAMSETALERLMREQREMMSRLFAQQLEAVRVTSAPPVPAEPAARSSSAPPVADPRVTPAPASSAASTGMKEEFKPFGPYKPPQKGVSGDLTGRQKNGLQSLIELYSRRTAKSKSMTQRDRQALADPRVVSGFRAQWKEIVYPIVTTRSKGSRLWDVDGNEYIDILNGFGPIMLGHRPDFVEKALEKQLHEGFEIGPQTPLAGEVAQMFCEMTGNERMTFCNTGSEAVIAALRVARTVTGRNKVVLFAGAYHGMFDEVLVKGFKKAGVPQSAPVAPGIPREKVANVVVLDYGVPESLEWIRQNAKDLAAVLVEPVQSRHPHLQPREFLKDIRAITQEAGAALIFDEVVTGFRVHPAGCQALFGIRADLATYGKVLAGGMPIGVLAGKAQFMDALDGGSWQFGDDSYPEVGVTFFAGTFVRHPLTLAAVKSVLEHFKEQGPELQEHLTERTTRMVRAINEIFESNHVPSRLESFGSIFYFAFPAEERFTSLFYYYLRAKGVHVLEGFPCFLTTAHSDADIEHIIRAFKESVADMQAAGFFPEPTERSATEVADNVTAEKPSAEAPLTESQLEVWLSDQLSEDASCSYNESFTLHVRGNVNESALKTAVQKIIDRHDALRASFRKEGDRQHFAQKLRLEIPTVDLAQFSLADREAALKQMIGGDAHTAFHLTEGPLVRAQLVKLEPRYQLLIFTSHHIVCDGWSTNVILDELSTIYNALNRGEACELPASMSFADYSRSQAQFLSGPDGENVERYWVEQFKDPPALLELPTDRPRPAMKEFNGATYRRRIGVESYNNIKKLAARQKCTLFVTLLGGFEILLSRLSGQSDIVVGVPTAGQSLVEDSVLVGHCVNFIPLRGRLEANPTAAEFLAQMKRTVLDGYDHQNYTYGRLVRKLSLVRDPSRLPLTEIQFNLERVGQNMRFDGLETEVDANPKSFVNFDVFLNVVESKDGLVLDCDYNTGLFDEATIARWLNCYETIFEGLITDVNRPVSQIPLLSEAQALRMTEHWNDTKVAFPRDLTVHKLFETQVKSTPNSSAVLFDEKQLTYSELDEKANQLAQHLRKKGVRRGALVGLFVERSLEMMIGLLGILKSGGAYVPIDPTFPPERLRYVLEDANAPLVLTQKGLTEKWSFGNAQTICLDADWSAISKERPEKPREDAGPNDLAYVIYTSGSTGKPKGVEVPHRAVANLLQAMLLKPGLAQKDTLAAVTTLSFDIAGLELFLPLCVGARLVIVSRETGSYGVQLLDYLKKVKATVMQATPVTWKLLMEAGWDGDPPLKVLCGGEAFPRELANDLLKRTSDVWNMYGPTETTIWSSAGNVTPGEGPVPIGPPIANTQFYVVDRELQVVPAGVPGELCIAGDGVARGYHKRPDLTSEKFVPNPFAKQAGLRMYRTGDLVRRRNDGALEFLGRLDDQIKLRGFRIELGEIESVLESHPGVKQAAVALREDVPGEKRLVGYIVPASGAAPAAAELRSLLLSKVPDYMVPAIFVAIESFPLTPNGKVNRRALPAPDWSKQSRGTAYAAPQTPEENAMAKIWAEILRLERVGVNDNLFELGADSLHVFQIAARASKAGMNVTPRHILQHRTIAAIFRELASATPGKGQVPSITPVSRQKYRVVRDAPQQVETKQ